MNGSDLDVADGAADLADDEVAGADVGADELLDRVGDVGITWTVAPR